jgi:hypothetical protein
MVGGTWIPESAPDTIEGSFSRSLQLSKLWMCRELKRQMADLGIPRFKKVYSLGSWYGNMALFMVVSHVPFDTMVDVDINQRYLDASRKLFPRLHASGRLVSICGDCNRLVYKLRQPSLVINNSTNNMRNDGWLERIPRGTMVAMQGRSNEPHNELNNAGSLEEFDRLHPLSETMFLGSIDLSDPGDSYQRWMKIGRR